MPEMVKPHNNAQPAIGIDGCRAGWLLCLIKTPDLPTFQQIRQLEELQSIINPPATFFIDMPFGLSSSDLRECDLLGRKLLNIRRSTLFLTPCRQAVYASSYQQACQINQAICGQKISRQAWNLTPKIKELDRFLRTHPSWQTSFFESHPELCFAYLNDGRVLRHSKKTAEGQQQRLVLLQQFVKIEMDFLFQWREQLGRSNVKIDDLIDALVLALCATFPARMHRFIPEKIMEDRFGLRMNLVLIQGQN